MRPLAKALLFLIALLLLPAAAHATRSIDAARVDGAVRIDGRLDESVWQRPGAGDFLQYAPSSGEPATESTEVWVAYDDGALYIAARMHDSRPASIARNFGRRDAPIESDWFWVGLDPYHDGRSGAYFEINPVGTIRDGVLYDDIEVDPSWDGIWERAAAIDDHGWAVEMRIPYSQLRFETRAEQVWGINFRRQVWQKGEESHFELMPREQHGFVSRFAELHGLAGIDPPARLELLPYVVSGGRFLQHDPADPFHSGHDAFADAGADVRLGIGPSLTLDATVNPDFGQVEVDPAVLNLSPSETFYQEKRPFFVEGSGIFAFAGGGGGNFGWFNPTFFYSRRIGRAPQGIVPSAAFADVPDRTTIYGAAKLTGRAGEHWTLGAMSAATARESAEVDAAGERSRVTVEPFTLYNVVRTRGEFNGGLQGIGMLGTATVRDLPEDGALPRLLSKSAVTAGIDGYTFLDDHRGWSVGGWAGLSSVSGTKERIMRLQRASQRYFQQPDATHLALDSDATSMSGWSGRLQLNKRSGNLRLGAALGAISPGFEANDIGYSGRADYLNWAVNGEYDWFEPDGIFRYKNVNAHAYQSFDFGGTPLNAAYGVGVGGQLESFWRFDATLDYTPLTYDTRSTRGGPMMNGPAGWFGNVSVNSDFRSPVIVSMYSGGGTSPDDIWNFYSGATVTIRPADQVQISLGPNWSRDYTRAGYVGTHVDSLMTATYGARYLFADLHQNTLSAEIRIDWAFTPELSLQVYAQPYFTTGDYTGFKELARPRTYDFNTYGDGGSTIEAGPGVYSIDPDGEGPASSFVIGDPDFNFKSLRSTVVLRWEYLPGSTLFLAWTHDRTDLADPGTMRVSRDLDSLLRAKGDNIVMLKVAYWISP
jgi:hypothetical protein